MRSIEHWLPLPYRAWPPQSDGLLAAFGESTLGPTAANLSASGEFGSDGPTTARHLTFFETKKLRLENQKLALRSASGSVLFSWISRGGASEKSAMAMKVRVEFEGAIYRVPPTVHTPAVK